MNVLYFYTIYFIFRYSDNTNENNKYHFGSLSLD